MTKDEFLMSRTQDVLSIFEESGNYSPTFAVLFFDGNTTSVATSFYCNGPNIKDIFNHVMHKMCENPEVVASTFTCEVWISQISKKENKRPSECSDRDSNINLVYNTRDGFHEIHMYKPDEKGKLQHVHNDNSFEGKFSNPFRAI